MCWLQFLTSCGCLSKVFQAWDIINTMGSWSSKPQSTQAVGQEDFVGTVKQWCHPQVGVVCYTKNNRQWTFCQSFRISCECINKIWSERDTINILRSCSSNPQSTQAVGPKDLVRSCKTMMPSSDWCRFLHVEQQAMGMLTTIPHGL